MDPQENPTAGDGGASIEERLERMLSVDAPQEDPKPDAKAPDPQADKDPDKPVDGDPEKAPEPQLTTAELAKIFGVDEDSFDVNDAGEIQVKTKIDGKEGAAKFADLLKNYQLQGHAENRARAVAEQEKALQTRMQEVDQVVKAKIDHVEQLANIAGADLMREYQSIDWNSLRQRDAGQYAALQQDFQNRRTQIQGVFQGVSAQRAEQARTFETHKAQYLRQEAEKLPLVIPEWKDEATRKKESSELIEWGRKHGYSDEQLNGLNESAALHIATVRKAMLYDRQQAQKPLVEKLVRQAPKIVKPGTPAPDSKETRLSDLKQTVRKSGGKGGSLEALLIAKGIA